MTNTRCLIILISILSFYTSKAQIKQIDVESAIEAIFNLPNNRLNYEELYERYLLLYETPLDLNLMGYADLKSIHAFSDDQINAILSYRDSIGQVRSIYELSYLDLIDPQRLKKLSPFLIVGAGNQMDNHEILKSIVSNEHASFILRFERRLEESQGYKGIEPAFVGDANKIYFRYRNVLDQKYSLGFTGEKDAGEASIDFWSAHLLIKNQGAFKKILIGDYQLQFGQGLVFNTGLGMGKGAETINTIEKVYNGLKPYTSVVEGGFLRGIATTSDINDKIQFTTFLSSLKQDASLRQSDDSTTVFSTFQINGLHRTDHEKARRKNVDESLFGFNLNYKTRNLNQVGLLWQSSYYSQRIDRGLAPAVLYEFRGDRNSNISIYGNKSLKKFRLFGEVAMSSNTSKGALVGIEGKITPHLQSVLLMRKYDRSFHSLRSGAFGESDRNINESGIYLGLKYTLSNQLDITAYYDRFYHEWLRFRTNRPSKGYDYLLRVNYRPNPRSHLYFQYRYKNKYRNHRDSVGLEVLPGEANRYILHLDLQVSKRLDFRSKVQWSNYRIANERTAGLAFFQDVNFSFNRFSISGRFSIFETNGAENRQYAYERDVLYAFSIPGLSGKGIRYYFLLQYSPTPQLNFWIKLSRTTFFDRSTFGTGVDFINNNELTDIKLQSVIKF